MKQIILLTFLLPLWVVSAQSATIDLASNPNEPRPGETVVISASSKELNLSQTKNRWLVNGKVVEEGIGKAEITITTPVASVPLEVTMTTGDGSAGQRSWMINDLDLLWEPNTTAPVFFQGHKLPAANSLVKFVAYPWVYSNGTKLKNSSLIYEWRRNDNFLPTVSGVGRNTLSLLVSRSDEIENITLTVSGPDGKNKVTRTVAITPEDSRIVIYQLTPDTGLLTNRAISSGDSFTSGLGLWAGLFYSPENQTPLVDWSVNGQPFSTTTNSNYFTLELAPNSAPGAVDVVATISGLISKSLNINLNKK